MDGATRQIYLNPPWFVHDTYSCNSRSMKAIDESGLCSHMTCVHLLRLVSSRAEPRGGLEHRGFGLIGYEKTPLPWQCRNAPVLETVRTP